MSVRVISRFRAVLLKIWLRMGASIEGPQRSQLFKLKAGSQVGGHRSQVEGHCYLVGDSSSSSTQLVALANCSKFFRKVAVTGHTVGRSAHEVLTKCSEVCNVCEVRPTLTAKCV